MFNSKKSANFAACVRGARAAKFSFLKNHRDLENEYFFFKVGMNFPLTSRPIAKIELKIRGCLVVFFLSSKMAKTVFDLQNSKK